MDIHNDKLCDLVAPWGGAYLNTTLYSTVASHSSGTEILRPKAHGDIRMIHVSPRIFVFFFLQSERT